MKTYHFTILMISIFSVFITAQLKAQDKTQGKIQYQQKINVHASLTKEYEAIKAMIPEFSESDVVVTFKNKKSKIKANESAPSSGDAMVMSMGSSVVEYVDFARKVFYKTLSVDGENYHTEMPIQKAKTKLLKGSERICGYNCKMVSFVSEKKKYIIYYTTEIKGSFSPMPGVFVDGVILKIENKTISYLAQKVTFKMIDDKAVSKASNSEKITQSQLMDLEEELLEEFISKDGENVKVIKTSN